MVSVATHLLKHFHTSLPLIVVLSMEKLQDGKQNVSTLLRLILCQEADSLVI